MGRSTSGSWRCPAGPTSDLGSRSSTVAGRGLCWSEPGRFRPCRSKRPCSRCAPRIPKRPWRTRRATKRRVGVPVRPIHHVVAVVLRCSDLHVPTSRCNRRPRRPGVGDRGRASSRGRWGDQHHLRAAIRVQRSATRQVGRNRRGGELTGDQESTHTQDDDVLKSLRERSSLPDPCGVDADRHLRVRSARDDQLRERPMVRPGGPWPDRSGVAGRPHPP